MFRLNLLDRASRFLPRRHAAPPAVPVPSRLAHVHGVDQVLAPHAALLYRMRNAYGHQEQHFEQHLLAPITEFAAWVHFLPGPPGSGFERRGGALEQALRTSLFSLQAADGRTFDGSNSASPSHDGTQPWRLACALGGLFTGLRQFVSAIEVASEEGELWPASAMPLLCWLQALPAPKYHYRWVAAKSESAWPALYVASRCINQATMSLLVRGDGQAAAGLLACVAGMDRAAIGPVSDVVARVVRAIAAREERAAPVSPAGLTGDRQVGVPASAQDDAVPPCDASRAGAKVALPAGDAARSAAPEPGPPAVQQDWIGECEATEDMSAVPGAERSLTLDTSRISNPRIREQVDDVVNRLEGSFDTMLSRIVPGGIFVALQEFVGQHADGAAVVRAAHEAGLLALDAKSAARRVSTERMEGTEVVGIVLPKDAFEGYAEWVARWQADAGARADRR